MEVEDLEGLLKDLSSEAINEEVKAYAVTLAKDLRCLALNPSRGIKVDRLWMYK